MNKSNKKSFWALMVTQFFGAFNDNIFKIITALLVIQWVQNPIAENNWKTISLVAFGLPFILFSLAAGRLADRYSKTSIIQITKIGNLVVVLAAILGIHYQNISWMMAALFLLATQSAFFGPSKYGILPELMEEKDLSNGNGLLNVFTFIAILLGSMLGTFLADRMLVVFLLMGVSAAGGLLASFLIEKLPAANPSQEIIWNPVNDLKKNWQTIREQEALKRSLLAVSFFWFSGAVLQINTLSYVENVLMASTKLSGILLLFIVLGVSAGSLLAGKLSKEKVEIGLVPLGAMGMTIFTVALYFSRHSFPFTSLNVFLLGLSSGFFVIPLNTLIQIQSPQEHRGSILATANFLSFVAILLAGVFIWISGSLFQADPARVFLYLGMITMGATCVIVFLIPQSLVRLIVYFLTNTVYAIRVLGRENVPLKGPALLVPNHVSMVDPFLVAGGISRLIRFIMYRDFYEKPFIHPLVKLMKAIPISHEDPPKEILRSLLSARNKLEEGHLVCIFAEGEISRLGGTVLGFKRGLEVILKDLKVPVIPVHLEGVWGSIFSFQGKKFIWKWPRKFPFPVTVTFGKPIQNPTAHSIRQAVMELGSDAFSIHRTQDPTLFESFISQAKCFPNQKVVADSSGKVMTYAEILTGATIFGNKLSDMGIQQTGGAVGVLLPPCVGAVIANVGMASQGFLPVNLNYTLSLDTIKTICEKAGINKIITSPKMIEKLGWAQDDKFIFVEDIIKNSNKSEKLIYYIATRFLPSRILKILLFGNASKKQSDLATLMFTSGSTGVPKGVMLTQANILSNIQAITMVLQMESKDVLLGVLPFFHSFGFTASLWYPLLAGFKVVFHTNPLDTKKIGELCRSHSVSFLVGTPTFLSAYIRRIPKEDFSSLRFAVAGAEKLRPELAQAFEEKYNVPILEGYGCTELSPVVALNIPNIVDGEVIQIGRKVGKIGRPMPGMSIKTVDPESYQPTSPGSPGLLLVKGPNVMKGYIGDPEKTAEVIKDGWYVTGDIATIDEDGFIEITDRLSRFSKIGGEMVPHIKIEQKLQELSGSLERQFVVASVPDDKKGEALVVLVAGYPGNLDELWKNLNATDLPKLWIPARDKFITIEALPVLGSGKLDMQQVKTIARDKLKII